MLQLLFTSAKSARELHLSLSWLFFICFCNVLFFVFPWTHDATSLTRTLQCLSPRLCGGDFFFSSLFFSFMHARSCLALLTSTVARLVCFATCCNGHVARVFFLHLLLLFFSHPLSLAPPLSLVFLSLFIVFFVCTCKFLSVCMDKSVMNAGVQNMSCLYSLILSFFFFFSC